MEKMKKVLIIMNPCSGTMRANKSLTEILQEFCRGGYETVIAMTQKRGDGTVIARERAADADLLVAIGGDGTFNEVAAGLLESGTKKPLGYIPAGSTNDFASGLGLSKGLVKAARDIVNGTPRPLDMGSFNGRTFSYVASFGAFTNTSYSVSQSMKNMLGHMAYILSGIKDVFSLGSYAYAIDMVNESDGTKFSGKYIFGAVCNSTSMGGVLTLSKDQVDYNDGLFEVLMIEYPTNLIKLNQIVTALTTQKYEECDAISFFRSSCLRINASEDMDWTLDGEYQKGNGEIVIRNERSALDLVMPPRD
ncbi:MAG: diacylglycerol/lipid kinase family protein [Anaerovoracaceae bacterium]|jgi:diacylglycerol kinase (ATP)